MSRASSGSGRKASLPKIIQAESVRLLDGLLNKTEDPISQQVGRARVIEELALAGEASSRRTLAAMTKADFLALAGGPDVSDGGYPELILGAGSVNGEPSVNVIGTRNLAMLKHAGDNPIPVFMTLNGPQQAIPGTGLWAFMRESDRPRNIVGHDRQTVIAMPSPAVSMDRLASSRKLPADMLESMQVAVEAANSLVTKVPPHPSCLDHPALLQMTRYCMRAEDAGDIVEAMSTPEIVRVSGMIAERIVRQATMERPARPVSPAPAFADDNSNDQDHALSQSQHQPQADMPAQSPVAAAATMAAEREIAPTLTQAEADDGIPDFPEISPAREFEAMRAATPSPALTGKEHMTQPDLFSWGGFGR